MKFTIGMPVFDDFYGVWSTVKALQLYFPKRIADIIVVDNNPGSAHGTMTRDFCANAGVLYAPWGHEVGTAAAKNAVFATARTEYVVCLDSHVMLRPGALDALAAFYETNPGKRDDLVNGPMVYDNGVQLSTHFDDVWPLDPPDNKPSQMWGQWGRDTAAFPEMDWEKGKGGPPALPRPAVPYFRIFAQGMGAFACRKAAWLGFHPAFRGFGGEECYIHEKFRRAGRGTWCVSGFLWDHRFGKPEPVKFPLQLWDKYRNYEIGFRELGLDPAPLRAHFVATGLVPAAWVAAIERGDLTPPAADGGVRLVPAAGCGGCGGQTAPAETALPAGDTIEVEYARVAATPGDISEHLPTLRALVEAAGPDCRVLELGTRDGVATTALLAGRPRKLTTIDPVTSRNARRLKLYADAQGTEYVVIAGPPVGAEPTPSDVLLVDMDPHTGEQVLNELQRHGPLAARYIAFHDTANHFGETHPNGGPGVMPAIRSWLRQYPEWTMIRRDLNNNGLVVISRDDRDKKHPPGIMKQLLNFSWAVLKHSADLGAPASETEFNRRIELCLVCPSRFGDQCGECGCPVRRKASWRSEPCPLNKWAKDEDAGAAP